MIQGWGVAHHVEVAHWTRVWLSLVASCVKHEVCCESAGVVRSASSAAIKSHEIVATSRQHLALRRRQIELRFASSASGHGEVLVQADVAVFGVDPVQAVVSQVRIISLVGTCSVLRGGWQAGSWSADGLAFGLKCGSLTPMRHDIITSCISMDERLPFGKRGAWLKRLHRRSLQDGSWPELRDPLGILAIRTLRVGMTHQPSMVGSDRLMSFTRRR
jgi:hypothetical protein